MKIEYQVYKRHHNNKFVGWGVGYERFKKKEGKLVVTSLVTVATFYGRKAKEWAEHFIDVLEFDRA